ncbi:MAG: DUF2726 domain-containing protein [Aggregatilineales bacterium]
MLTWLQRFVDFLKRLFRNITQGVSSAPKPPIQQKLKLEADVPPEYRKVNSLLTFQERKFYYTVLLQEVGSHYRIYPKVRLGDLIRVANNPKDKRNHEAQLWCKHIDFVVCNGNTLEPLLAIELDDSSHQFPDRQESDLLKDRVCDEADLPLMRVKVEGDYPVSTIGEEIRKLLDNTGVIK